MKRFFAKTISGILTACMVLGYVCVPVFAEPENEGFEDAEAYTETVSECNLNMDSEEESEGFKNKEQAEAESSFENKELIETEESIAETGLAESEEEDMEEAAGYAEPEEETSFEEDIFEEEISLEMEMESGCIEDDEDYPDDEEMLMGYLYESYFGDNGISTLSIGTQGLEGVNLNIYNALAAKIEKVAAGELASSEFVFNSADIGLKTSLTPADCGVSSFTEANASSCLTKYLNSNVQLNTVIDYALVNMPYHLYWFDKTVGWKYGAPGVTYTSNVMKLPSYKVQLCVDSSCSKTKVKGEFTTAVDTAMTAAPKQAAAAASAIVEANQGKSDLARLTAYKDEICRLTSYDRNASSGNNKDGSPWQLIYVFDGDTSTNVVCEGYSKAFQFLCDLDWNLDSYIVNGLMGGGTGAGRHMWNIVRIDGKSYLVDVTNSDSGSVGQNGGLFMAKAGTKEAVSKYATITGSEFETTCYSYKIGSSTIWYTYVSKLRDMYGSILELSDTAYTDSGSTTPQPPVIYRAEAPVFSIPSGNTVEKDTFVSIKSGTPGASIYYTYSTDGSTPANPDKTNSSQLLSSDLKITDSMTIKAIAVKDGYEDSSVVTVSYTVDSDVIPSDRKDLKASAFWVTGIDPDGYEFTGTAIKPDVRVYFDNKRLSPNIDYTITYKNNINVGKEGKYEPSLTVTGRGSYSGKVTKTFKINKINIENVKLAANEFPAKSVYTPVIMTADEKTVLRAGTDYVITYHSDRSCTLPAVGKNNKTQPKETGQYYIKIEGKGANCTGRKDFLFSIKGELVPISKVKITVGQTTVNGENPTITAQYNDGNLRRDTDYIAVFPKALVKGTGYVTIIGQGKYSGTVKKAFRVNPVAIDKKDYYGNELAEVKIDGAIARDKVRPSVKYEKGGVKPVVSVRINGGAYLKEGVDYSVTYAGNAKISADEKWASVTIRGKGNYSGVIKREFRVSEGDMGKWKVFVSDVAMPAKSGKAPAKPTVLVYDGNGKKLAVNSDYKVEYVGSNVTDYTGYSIKLTGGSNKLYKLYSDNTPDILSAFSSGFSYKVLDKSKIITSVALNKKAVGYTPQLYNGSEQTLRNEWLTVKIGNEVLASDRYVIEEGAYINNVNKGTASVIVKGNPAKGYGGMKVLNFNIGAHVVK